MKKILGQILSSSLEDTQGEIFTKQDLIDLAEAANKKAPIDFNQRHDPKLGKLGYINNFKGVPSRIHLNEYDLIGDIYLSIDEIPPDLKAFSLSTIKPIYGNSDAKIAFFIPYPFYQNEEYLKSLFIDNEIIIGKHIQKAAEVPLVALIISKIVSTIVDKVFEKTVYPVLKRNFSIIIELWKKSIETNLIIWQQTNNFQYQIMFISNKSFDNSSYDSDVIFQGRQIAQEEFLKLIANSISPKIIKLVYIKKKKEYQFYKYET